MDGKEETESVRSSLGLLQSDALSDISGLSGFESSLSSKFVALSTEDEDGFDDFEPTPIAYSNSETPKGKEGSDGNGGCLPSKLLIPSESTPNTPSNKGGMAPAVQRLLKGLLAAAAASNSSNVSADNSRLSWDKVFNNNNSTGLSFKDGGETPSFCTGQFSARSTSFGNTNSSSTAKVGSEEDTRDERFSDYTNPQSFMPTTHSVQSVYSDKDSPFGGSTCFFESPKFSEQQREQQGNEFEKEEFRELSSDFINEAEKENKEKYRFIQEQTMSSDVASGASKLGFSNFSTTTNASAILTDDQLSRSQYFMMNTSRLGNSIFNATDDSNRPHLGFEAIKSPELKGRPLIENPVESNSSSPESTFTINDVSDSSTISNKSSNIPKQLLFSNTDTESSISLNDSKVLEQALKNKLSSDGQLDLNFISMLMNNTDHSSLSVEDKKVSAEYLVSMILKSLESSGENDKASDTSCITGTLPSFLDVSSAPRPKEGSNNLNNSTKSLPVKSRKKSSGARHSSPIRRASPQPEQLKIQPIKSVIKSSKSVENDPNVSIVIMDSLKKNQSSSSVQLQVLTREGDKIDFGTLPEDCSTTEDLVLVHSGERDQEIRLEIQGQLPSFIYPSDGQTRHINMVSSKTIVVTLPAISLSKKESVAFNIKISIHTPASPANSSSEIRTLHSQINILWSGRLLAQVPMVARVGQAKLQTLKSDKILPLICTPNGSWVEHLVPMMNSGNIPMTISLTIVNPSLGLFKIDPSLITLLPKKEYKAALKFSAQDVGETECVLRCTVQPNGTTYEVPIKISSKFFAKEGDKENSLAAPMIQFGKLPTSKGHEERAENNNTNLKPASLKRDFVFPVEADKSFLNWFAVPIGTSEEQTLILKNALEDSIAVNVIIRDSDSFKIKVDEEDDYKNSIAIKTIPGGDTQSIKVSFMPTTLKNSGDQLIVGKLVLKPKLRSTGKNYKATILLQGNAGAPELSFSGFGDEINGKQSLFLGQLMPNKVLTRVLSVRNKGSGPAFFTCMALGDHGIKSEAITFDGGDSYCLYPNENITLKVNVDPSRISMGDKNHVFVGFINVFYGSEYSRSAMKQALVKVPPSQKLSYQSSAFPGCVVNFNSVFQGEITSFNGVVGPNDVKHFYKSTKKLTIELSGVTGSREESFVKFNALPVEETLSESHMDSTNYNSILLNTQPHSPPTRCSPIPEERHIEKKIFEIYDEEIFVESRKTVLVTIRNATNIDQRFDLGWPAHILMVQPSSGVIRPNEGVSIAITALAPDKRKGAIAVYSAGDSVSPQSISFNVLPPKLTIEPDKIKFAHPGTEMILTLKNHTDANIQWESKDKDPSFIISATSGSLGPSESIDFSILYQPAKFGTLLEKTFCFSGKIKDPGGERITAVLDVSGGQQPSHIPIPLTEVISTEVTHSSASEYSHESGNKKTVYLDKESITFPETKVGEYSAVKVIVKNRLNTAQVFNVEHLNSPFSTKYHEAPIIIKPMSYLGFPVTFTPMAKGNYKQNIVLKNNHKILVGTLMGICK